MMPTKFDGTSEVDQGLEEQKGKQEEEQRQDFKQGHEYGNTHQNEFGNGNINGNINGNQVANEQEVQMEMAMEMEQHEQPHQQQQQPHEQPHQQPQQQPHQQPHQQQHEHHQQHQQQHHQHQQQKQEQPLQPHQQHQEQQQKPEQPLQQNHHHQQQPQQPKQEQPLRQQYHHGEQQQQHHYQVDQKPPMMRVTPHGVVNRYDRWHSKFEELKEYKEKYGDCLVPTVFRHNPQLGNWVHTQRRHYKRMKDGKKSLMNEERVNMLESLGFVWCVRTEWDNNPKAKRDKGRHLGPPPEISPQPKKMKFSNPADEDCDEDGGGVEEFQDEEGEAADAAVGAYTAPQPEETIVFIFTRGPHSVCIFVGTDDIPITEKLVVAMRNAKEDNKNVFCSRTGEIVLDLERDDGAGTIPFTRASAVKYAISSVLEIAGVTSPVRFTVREAPVVSEDEVEVIL